jgi:hypothetical protein
MFKIVAIIVLIIVLSNWIIIYKVKLLFNRNKPIGAGIMFPQGELFRLYALSKRNKAFKKLFYLLLISFLMSYGSVIGLILLIFTRIL